MKTSNALIQQLLKAEEEAEQIINVAKENRVKMLKDARFSAEEELKVYKSKEEDRFKVEVEKSAGQDDSLTTELASKTKADIEIIKNDFTNNKDGVIEYIQRKVLAVDTSMDEKVASTLTTYEAKGIAF